MFSAVRSVGFGSRPAVAEGEGKRVNHGLPPHRPPGVPGPRRAQAASALAATPRGTVASSDLSLSVLRVVSHQTAMSCEWCCPGARLGRPRRGQRGARATPARPGSPPFRHMIDYFTISGVEFGEIDNFLVRSIRIGKISHSPLGRRMTHQKVAL